jgi:hypothetical protein
MPSRTELAAVWRTEVARAAGHENRTLPLEAIRAKCLDCSCYRANEVRLCEAVKCPLWPFRAGRYPVGRVGDCPSCDASDDQSGDAGAYPISVPLPRSAATSTTTPTTASASAAAA